MTVFFSTVTSSETPIRIHYTLNPLYRYTRRNTRSHHPRRAILIYNNINPLYEYTQNSRHIRLSHHSSNLGFSKHLIKHSSSSSSSSSTSSPPSPSPSHRAAATHRADAGRAHRPRPAHRIASRASHRIASPLRRIAFRASRRRRRRRPTARSCLGRSDASRARDVDADARERPERARVRRRGTRGTRARDGVAREHVGGWRGKDDDAAGG